LKKNTKDTADQAPLGWLQGHHLEGGMFFVGWEYGAKTFRDPRCHFKAIQTANSASSTRIKFLFEWKYESPKGLGPAT
jgi:hypothetical protein